jgi:2-aminoadipate transaminase
VVNSGFLAEHLPKIRALYKNQCQVMIESLREHLPAGVHFTVPEGGMFLWLTLPEGIDTMKLLDAAVAANVAFVPGAPFYANEITPNTLRLSFVTVPPEKIRAGVKLLAEVIKKAL